MNQSLFSVNATGPWEIPVFVIWIIFGLFMVIYTIVSGILIYHWRKYGMKTRPIIVAETIYIMISLVLIAGAILSILSYSNA